MVGVEVGAVVGVAALDTIGTVAAGSVGAALTAASADVVLTMGSADEALRTVRLEASMVEQAAFTAEGVVDFTVAVEVVSAAEAVADSTEVAEVVSTAAVEDTGNR